MIGEWCRKKVFWLVDYVRGGVVKKHYKDIKYMCENNKFSKGKIEVRLTQLLTYATENVDMYKAYKNFKKLSDFPIVDKKIISDAGDGAFSRKFDKDNVVKMYTSGSSGTSFVSYQNIDKKNRVKAEVIYFGELCNYTIGDRNVYLRVWSEENKKSFISACMQNMIMIDITKLDEEILERIRKKLKSDKRIKCILGYPSTYEILSTYCLEHNDNPGMFNINTIISSAETLTNSTRRKLELLFGCKIVSRYANQENGILAQELKDKSIFVLNKGSYFFEFLKLNSDERANHGELARVVVTDLYNYEMPMIRYDTKDVAVAGEDDVFGEVIVTIFGRREDQIYSVEGVPISIGTVDYDMQKYNYLDQYQVIQESESNYTLNVVGAEGVYKEEDLIVTMKDILGEGANITIMHMENIPRLKSGKYQLLVSNYNPQIKEELMKIHER
ncbi:MAG: hypothetical protein CVV02_08700 [Firmicutes bacterium HGW-Firmicutes-7]|nr:MAG: hypothetical protein CVV02_08700 [Firmicutes bacterium HGW-Firmicutes-7]